ncbi:MAG TPA: right-handed parallel beta-helix repeat-containing protein [Planctomycetota bacterium]|nr:right-handed parallel beta-helix repeat-containing protein [Planctomycetota bacterium]
MHFSNLFAGTVRTLAPLFLCAVSLADVIYVDAGGNGQYAEIQPAITAALDGDVLLVRSGSYPGFTIDNRSLSVIADVGALPKLNSTVVVRNLGANRTVLLAGLSIIPPQSPSQLKGIEVTDNVGHVRIQSCTIQGSRGFDQGGHVTCHGGHAASIVNSSKVAFVACSLNGGNGGGIPLFIDYGGYGGHGAVTQGSSVAFYDCLLKGGHGGDADYVYGWEEAGDGGDGCKVIDFGILASGCQFQGGMGGGFAWVPGDGGNGLRVDAGQAQLVGNTYVGGYGGQSVVGVFGTNGLPQVGAGVFHTFAGVARKIAGPSLAAENATMQIDVTGAPGDKVWLLQTPQPGFLYFPAQAGMRLVALLSSFTVKPDTVLPPSGTATVVVRTRDLPTGTPVTRQYWQCLIENTAGQLRLGSPLHVAVLNCSDLLPDCDGNGSCDTCDLLSPAGVDCDKNGVPDSCQPDCNGNGQADTCDIANGGSLDQNHNGIPDECETHGILHVDASAVPGGNGTAGAPFQTLGAAFAIAINNDTVRVANGLYQGSGNRGLDFAGRNLVVEAPGGAANCIIDCQLQGRAFLVRPPGSTSGSRVEGFTIRNGKVTSPDYGGGMLIQGVDFNARPTPVIRRCVFENCEAGFTGGGIFTQYADPLIEGCNFIGNKAPAGWGGGLIASYGLARIRDCNFVGNQSPKGAGVAVLDNARIERCLFQSNVATTDGGAIWAAYGDIFFDQCLIAGNTARVGGGIGSQGGQLHLTNCILVDNRATQSDGAMFFPGPYDPQPVRSCRNSIFWNNTSPFGTSIEVQGGVLDIAWCDIQGGQASVTPGANAILSWGPGNLTADPLFVDRDGPDNNALTIADNDYRLSLTSPCLDAGENASVAQDWFDLDGDGNVSEPVPFDFDGYPRFVDIPSAPNTGSGVSPLVDLGAWERP